MSEPSNVDYDKEFRDSYSYFEVLLIDGTLITFDKLCNRIEPWNGDSSIIAFKHLFFDDSGFCYLAFIPVSNIKQIIHWGAVEKLIEMYQN